MFVHIFHTVIPIMMINSNTNKYCSPVFVSLFVYLFCVCLFVGMSGVVFCVMVFVCLFWFVLVDNLIQFCKLSSAHARSINLTRFTFLDPGSLFLWNKSYWIHEGPSKSVQVLSGGSAHAC